jgi:hypothetical protein
MKTIKNNFNLVEIILAMGIIIVCITTIMGMLSFGMKVSNDAVMQNYMSTILGQLGGFVESEHTKAGDVPTLLKAPYDEDLQTSAVATQLTAAQVLAEEDACLTALEATDPFFKNVFYDGTTMDTIKIEYKTTIGTDDAIDFTAYARMYIIAETSNVNTTDSSNAAISHETLYIQVTWPGNKPYADRVLEGNVVEYKKVMRP